MQNLPCKSRINKYCSVIKNYCEPLNLTYCDVETDYKTLRDNKVSLNNTLNCLQAIIFVIESNVMYPRYQKELLLLQNQDNNFDPSYILNNKNIIDKKEFCNNYNAPNIETKECEYYKQYEKIINGYINKSKHLRLKIQQNNENKEKQIREYKEPSVNLDSLDTFHNAFYIFISLIDTNYLKNITVDDIINVRYINPNINIRTVCLKNYINLIDKKLIFNNQIIINIKNDSNDGLLEYVKEYNIQHEHLLFNIKRTAFIKIFKSIFNCNFIDYKKFLNS